MKKMFSTLGTFGSGKTTFVREMTSLGYFEGRELLDYLDPKALQELRVDDDITDVMVSLLKLRDSLFTHSSIDTAIYDQDAIALLAFQFSRAVWGRTHSYVKIARLLSEYYKTKHSYAPACIIVFTTDYITAVQRMDIRKEIERDTHSYFRARTTFDAFLFFYQKVLKNTNTLILDTKNKTKSEVFEIASKYIVENSNGSPQVDIYSKVEDLKLEELIREFGKTHEEF